MRTSENGINMIKGFEGCELEAYYDPVGVLTIGYGTTNRVNHYTHFLIQPKSKISKEFADKLLRLSLPLFEAKVNKYSACYHWTQNEFDALVCFTYNIGNIDGLTKNGTRSRQEIYNKFTEYNKANHVELTGLTTRRITERDLFMSKQVHNDSKSKEVFTIGKTIKKGDCGNIVKMVQAVVGAKIDGIFGNDTETKIKIWQEKHKLAIDGIVGSKTWNSFIN